jgi:TetR/AcrR family transcriptional repressor of bet genes
MRVMMEKARVLEAVPAPGRERTDRRAQIVDTLRKCILTKGYADTSLSDLARGAGLTVSHLLYYFPSKQAVLEKLCREFLGRLTSDFKRHRDKPPEEQMRILVDQTFAGKPPAESDLKIGLEFVALSMHQPVIRKIMREHNASMMEYLTELFSKVPPHGGISAGEAARIAAGLRLGLFTNSIYDEGLSSQYIRKICRQLFLAWAGMPDPYAEKSPKGRPRSSVSAATTPRKLGVKK